MISSPQGLTGTDEQFSKLVDELTERLQSREEVDLEACVREFPLYEPRLRAVFPALKALVDLGVSVSSGSRHAKRPLEAPEPTGTLGDFQLIREIGRGGMGVVYEARQISLNRRVAVKILPFAGALDPRRLERFRNEAMAAAQLRHPNIVGVHFVGSERGVHFYAMEYIEGRTLAEWLAELRGDPAIETTNEQPTGEVSFQPAETEARETQTVAALSTEQPRAKSEHCRQVAEWGLRIAEALEYAHSVGVVHRDIKPSNILVDATGHVWVTDFGLAQVGAGEAGLTMSGDILGTLRYMSPEQAQGDRRLVDHRTDLYSLGITLYELLTLIPAFPATDRVRLLYDVTQTDPKSPRQIDPQIPADLETIVLKAIRKEASERYKSLQELADDLKRFLNHEPIRARRPSLKDRIAKWSRRHRSLVQLGGLAAVVMSVVIAIAWVLVIQERGKRFQERQDRQYQAALDRAELSEERAKRIEEEQARKISDALAQQGVENQRHHAYVSNIQLAWQAWNRSQLAEMKRHLEICIPNQGETDLRSWEWRYLWRLCHEVPETIGEHEGQAYFLALSYDETRVASCGPDGARIWDVETTHEIKHLDEHRADVNWVSFSPDGQYFTTASDDHTAKIWETENWTVVKTFSFDNIVLGAEFSPDGKRLAIVERGYQPEQNRINIYSAKDWNPQRSWHAHEGLIHSLAFSPNSRFLATCADDYLCKVWDLGLAQDAPELRRLPNGLIPTCVSFLPDGKHVVVAVGRALLIVWNIETGEVVASVDADRKGIEGMTLAPRRPDVHSQQFLVTASNSGRADFWILGKDPLLAERGRTYLCPVGVRSAVATTQGMVFTADREGKIRQSTYSEANNRIIKIGGKGPLGVKNRLGFVGAGEKVLQGGCGLYVYSAATGRPLRELSAWESSSDGGELIAISDDQTRFAATTPEGGVQVWNARSFKIIHEWPEAPIPSWDWNSTSEWLGMSVNRDEVFLFDAHQDTLRFDVASGRVTSVNGKVGYFGRSPDGKYRIEKPLPSFHCELRNVGTGDAGPVTTPGNTSAAAWSIDGELFAAVTWEGMLHLWEAQGWKKIATFQSVPHGSHTLDFSVDAQTMAVADDRGDIVLWNIATKRELFRLRFPGDPLDVSFSRNGISLGVLGRKPHPEFWIWNATPPNRETLK